MNSLESTVRRLDVRPNHSIITYGEVGLPVFYLEALLSLQEDAPIGPIHEFVLKCISLGISESSEISDFLGLPPSIVKKQIGAFIYEGLIAPGRDESQRCSLTKKGVAELAVARRTTIQRQQVPLYMDGVTRRIEQFERRSLYNAKQLEEIGIGLVPALPRRPPKGSEIDIDQINRVFGLAAGVAKVRRKALKLEAIVSRTRLYYQRAVCLAFKSEVNGRVAVGFSIDGRLSEDHEIHFARSTTVSNTKLFGSLLDSTKRRREVLAVRRHIQEKMPAVQDRLDEQDEPTRRKTLRLRKKDTRSAVSAVPKMVRALHVYEHAPLLMRALTEARSRLLIISPWIRANVVDEGFLSLLTQRLERRVRVFIAYGLGRIDRGENQQDADALSKLQKLSARYPNLQFIRKGNTHAKVLIVDDEFCVTTSFNWLSFKGDPNQPFREEWGTYIEGRSLVEEYFQEVTKTLKLE